MIVLALHSTTPRLGVAITKGPDILGELTRPPSREHLENVVPAIEDLTQRTGIHLEDIHGFAAATGPGTFSGIRVGLAVVKGLALALKKPAVGVSSLDVIAWRATRHAELVVPVIDARRHEVYTAVYRRAGDDVSVVEGPYLMSLEDFAKFLDRHSGPLVVCGDRVADAFVESRSNLVKNFFEEPSPADCALLARERLERGDPGLVHALIPHYIRRSDAEVNRSRVIALRENG